MGLEQAFASLDPVLPGALRVLLGERPDVGVQLGYPAPPVGQLELGPGFGGHAPSIGPPGVGRLRWAHRRPMPRRQRRTACGSGGDRGIRRFGLLLAPRRRPRDQGRHAVRPAVRQPVPGRCRRPAGRLPASPRPAPHDPAPPDQLPGERLGDEGRWGSRRSSARAPPAASRSASPRATSWSATSSSTGRAAARTRSTTARSSATSARPTSTTRSCAGSPSRSSASTTSRSTSGAPWSSSRVRGSRRRASRSGSATPAGRSST